MLAICNACRYCEGYCAVFPALERRLSFDEGDVHYLANLCHNCGACLYACQYAPPHEFALNFPRVLAQVRKRDVPQVRVAASLRRGVRAQRRRGRDRHGGEPRAVPGLHGLVCRSRRGSSRAWSGREGSFYAVLPHGVMAGVFGAVFAFVVLALRRELRALLAGHGRADARVRAARGAGRRHVGCDASLKYLDGGGDGCTYPDATALVRAAHVPPPDVLRLPALLRRDDRRDDLPLRVRLEGAVSRSTACR